MRWYQRPFLFTLCALVITLSCEEPSPPPLPSLDEAQGGDMISPLMDDRSSRRIDARSADYHPVILDLGEGELNADVQMSLALGDRSLFLPPDAATLEGCAPRSPCGTGCADLQRDPENCGACGRRCFIPNGYAACEAGRCLVDGCEFSFFDDDGLVENGCEYEEICIAGTACESSCASVGTVRCESGRASCTPPPETCDGADNDCDGLCDEDALDGCRVPLHRAFGDGHLYHDDLARAGQAPFRVEFSNYFYLYQRAVGTPRPVFLGRKPRGRFFLTSSTDCERQGAPNRELGFWAPDESCGAVPLYRLYKASVDNHFYTLNAGERDRAADMLGYQREGIAGYVWLSP
ncbi:MAG: hypothetical protein VYD19_06910 [Myxococcota bacterium]|nr:hypothetical protein [Myxococcota bacterium]